MTNVRELLKRFGLLFVFGTLFVGRPSEAACESIPGRIIAVQKAMKNATNVAPQPSTLLPQWGDWRNWNNWNNWANWANWNNWNNWGNWINF
jgi:hypothetical protein